MAQYNTIIAKKNIAMAQQDKMIEQAYSEGKIGCNKEVTRQNDGTIGHSGGTLEHSDGIIEHSYTKTGHYGDLKEHCDN